MSSFVVLFQDRNISLLLQNNQSKFFQNTDISVTIPSVDELLLDIVINLPVCHVLYLFGKLHHADSFYNMP